MPPHFDWVASRTISACINAYVADKNAQYAFDEDHAAIAFPVECLKHTFQSITGFVPTFADDQKNFLSECRRNCGGTQALSILTLS